MMLFPQQSACSSVSFPFFACVFAAMLAMPQHADAQTVVSPAAGKTASPVIQNMVGPVQPNNSATADKAATDSTAEQGTDPNNTAGPRPVPKRLSAQERWNRLTPEERSVIINEWQKLDETIRPVFPVFRDNALEAQALQQGPISPASIAPAQSSVAPAAPVAPQPVTTDANTTTH